MRILGMFTKYWVPGTVKTRLAEAIGKERAATVYRLFVEHLTSELTGLAQEQFIVVSPDKDVNRSFFQASSWSVVGQGGGDLGQRLERFYRRTETEASVVVIGGDCPSLSRATILESFEFLEDTPVVLGPSQDGGYYLIGLRLPWKHEYRKLFQYMPWGTSDVLSSTIDRLRSEGLRYSLLSEDQDVDTKRDLDGLLERLNARDSEGALLQNLTDVLEREAE